MPANVVHGDYLIHHLPTDTYLTNTDGATVLAPLSTDAPLTQMWNFEYASYVKRYSLMSYADSLYLKKDGGVNRVKSRIHVIQYAKDSNCCLFSNTTPTYWFVTSDGSLVFDQMTLLYGFPFELIPASPVNRIETISQPSSSRSAPFYITPDGIRHSSPQRGINILRVDGKTMKLMR
jgi:hypothetical protein